MTGRQLRKINLDENGLMEKNEPFPAAVPGPFRYTARNGMAGQYRQRADQTGISE